MKKNHIIFGGIFLATVGLLVGCGGGSAKADAPARFVELSSDSGSGFNRYIVLEDTQTKVEYLVINENDHYTNQVTVLVNASGAPVLGP